MAAEVIITGTLHDASGNPLVGVVVTADLANFGTTPPTVTGTRLLAPLGVKATTDASGNFSLPVYGNYQISPASTYYSVSYEGTSAGYVFNVAGTYDLSAISPYTPTNLGLVSVAPTYPNYTAPTPLTGDNSANVATTTYVNAQTAYLNNQAYAVNFSGSDLGAKVNNAVTGMSALGGGTVILPTGTWNVSTEINPVSNVNIQGAGQNKTILVGIGSGRVIHVSGTSGSHVSNVRISHLTVKNGTAQTGNTIGTAGRDGIRVDYADYVTIENCTVTSIQGSYGIVLKACTFANVYNNTVTNFTYAGILCFPGCHDIHIENNYVDTATTSYVNSYGIVGGSTREFGGDPEGYSYNIWIRGNTVKNIPTWEAIDFHGGHHLWIENNYVENCYVGILTALVTGGISTDPTLYDVTIRNNKIIQGTATLNGRAIICQGESQSAFASDFWVEGNYINGYGAGAAASAFTLGAIDVRYVKGVSVEGNHFLNYSQQALYMISVIGAKVRANHFYDMVDRFPANTNGACVYLHIGNWDVTVENNSSNPSTPALSPYYFFRTGSLVNNFSLGRNYIKSAQTGDYFTSSATLYFTAAPTTASALMLKNGDPIFDANGRVGWYASCGDGFFGLSTLTITTANISSSSTTLNGFTGGSGSTTWYHWLPPGANISIAGAGVAGATLNAKVLANDGTNVTLDTAASTSVTGANVTYQVPTVVSANQWWNEWESVFATDPAKGYQVRGDKVAFKPSSIGFRFSDGAPCIAYNAIQTATNSDNWTQTDNTKASYLIRLSNTGVQYYYAASGTAAGNFATFWGTALSSSINTGATLGGTTATTTLTATTSATIGGGTPITKAVIYTPSLTPTSVAANTTAGQTYTVTGLTTADKVIVNPPSMTAGTGLVAAWASGANTLSIQWSNMTAGALTPVSGTYQIVAIRS